jgi:hypothetical protein
MHGRQTLKVVMLFNVHGRPHPFFKDGIILSPRGHFAAHLADILAEHPHRHVGLQQNVRFIRSAKCPLEGVEELDN